MLIRKFCLAVSPCNLNYGHEMFFGRYLEKIGILADETSRIFIVKIPYYRSDVFPVMRFEIITEIYLPGELLVIAH